MSDEGVQTTDESSAPTHFRHALQECLFVLTATMAVGQTSFFTGLVTVITASIGRDLKMNSAEITWISAGMALTSGAFLLPCGKVADVFGRKRIFVMAMAGFSVTLLVSGFAISPLYMDVISGALGLFAAIAVPPAIGALGVMYERPSKRKNRAFACFSAGNPLAFVGGMLISGVATDVANWRVSFWTLAILYAAFTFIALWTMPNETSRPSISTRSFWKGCDIPGMLLSVIGIAFASASFSLAGDAPRGWRESYVLVLLILGVAFIFLFLWWQSVCSSPLMPLHIWQNSTFSLLVVSMALGYTGFSTSQFWMALYMQRVQNLSSLQITVRMLPLAINGLMVNFVCGMILHKVSNKLLMFIASLAYTGAFLIMSFTCESSSYWVFYFCPMILMVVGADIQFNIANMYVMSSFSSLDQSLGGSIFNTVTKLCTALGLGITTTIYETISEAKFESSIRPYLATYWFAAGLAGASFIFLPFLNLGTQGAKSFDTKQQARKNLDHITIE